MEVVKVERHVKLLKPSAKEMVNDWTAALKNSPDAESETERATGKKRKDVNNLGS